MSRHRSVDVSVIVPVRNAAATLPACLQGLASQSGVTERVEWIFVDNDSSDHSSEVLRADTRVKLLVEKRSGAYVARNTGAAAAEGRVLAFLDPDCVPDRLWLRSMLDALAPSGVRLVLGLRRPTPNVGLNQLLGDYDATRDRWMLTCGEPSKCYGYTNNMAVLREAWNRYGPFDDRPRGADTIFVRRLTDGEGCAAITFAPSMIVSHLEMDGVRTYLLKTFTYGRSLQSYQRTIAVQPLTMGNRLDIFRTTARIQSYGVVKTLSLGFLLMLGLGAWTLGRLRGGLTRH